MRQSLWARRALAGLNVFAVLSVPFVLANLPGDAAYGNGGWEAGTADQHGLELNLRPSGGSPKRPDAGVFFPSCRALYAVV